MLTVQERMSGKVDDAIVGQSSAGGRGAAGAKIQSFQYLPAWRRGGNSIGFLPAKTQPGQIDFAAALVPPAKISGGTSQVRGIQGLFARIRAFQLRVRCENSVPARRRE